MNIVDLYSNFLSEYIILFLILGVYYASSIISDEFQYETIIDLFDKKIIFTKLFVILLYFIFIFIISFLLNYDISLIIFHKSMLNIKVIKEIMINLRNTIPVILSIYLLAVNLSIVFRKSNISIIITYLIYFGSTYLDNYIVSHNYHKLYYLFTLNLNFNKHYLINNYVPISVSILISITLILVLVILSNILFKYFYNKNY